MRMTVLGMLGFATFASLAIIGPSAIGPSALAAEANSIPTVATLAAAAQLSKTAGQPVVGFIIGDNDASKKLKGLIPAPAGDTDFSDILFVQIPVAGVDPPVDPIHTPALIIWSGQARVYLELSADLLTAGDVRALYAAIENATAYTEYLRTLTASGAADNEQGKDSPEASDARDAFRAARADFLYALKIPCADEPACAKAAQEAITSLVKQAREAGRVGQKT